MLISQSHITKHVDAKILLSYTYHTIFSERFINTISTQDEAILASLFLSSANLHFHKNLYRGFKYTILTLKLRIYLLYHGCSAENSSSGEQGESSGIVPKHLGPVWPGSGSFSSRHCSRLNQCHTGS